jgi:peptide/nickel transport system permease protein
VAALAAPALLPGDPLAIVRPAAARARSPMRASRSAPTGLGRDILAGVVHGARASLVVGLAVAAVALAIGAALGALAGYLGGVLDEIVMRIADAVQTVPSFLLALAFVSVFGPSLPALVAALAISAWTAPARIVRAEAMSLRLRAYVEASRLIGRQPIAIACLGRAAQRAAARDRARGGDRGWRDPVGIRARLPRARRPQPRQLGCDDRRGRSVLRTAPHVIVAPGLALLATVLAVSLLGEALARRLAGHRAG